MGWRRSFHPPGELPLRTASLDLVTAFTCVRHFDLGRFLSAVARVLQRDGQLSSAPAPGSGTRGPSGAAISRVSPGTGSYAERGRAPGRRPATDELKVVTARTFTHPRLSTAKQLRAQAEGLPLPGVLLCTDELRASIATFLARLPSPGVSWVDEHLLVVIGGSRRNQAEADGPGSRASRAIKGSGPPDQRRARR